MISLRAAAIADLSQIVAIHRQAFAGFFLTRLGPLFLREYYRTVMEYRGGILLMAIESSGRTVGFAAGHVHSEHFYRTLRGRRYRLVAAALPSLIAQPSLVPQLLTNSRRVTAACQSARQQNLNELSSLAVLPDVQGQGVGSRLVRKFVESVVECGASELWLTTDSERNERVNDFYRKLGFELIERFQAQGNRSMNRYWLNLDALCQEKVA